MIVYRVVCFVKCFRVIFFSSKFSTLSSFFKVFFCTIILVLSSIYSFLVVFQLLLHSRNHDEQVRDVSDLVHQIRCNSLQALVSKVARGEDVHDIRCVLTAWIGDVDDSSCLFLLEIVDEAHLQVLGLP
jgi:hypothetical protein